MTLTRCDNCHIKIFECDGCHALVCEKCGAMDENGFRCNRCIKKAGDLDEKTH